MIKGIATLVALLICHDLSAQSSVFLEAEGFADTGGWTNDNQSMMQMGSPYLIAHGLGRPVAEATTTFTIKSPGTYRLWVRTRDWTKTWGRTESPGRFQVIVNGEAAQAVFGTESELWTWQDGGTVDLPKGENTISLHDLTGFEGRCDAVYLTKDINAKAPDPTDRFRRKALKIGRPEKAGKYDFVVVGGGIAGICAAISAARLGCKVALVQNRLDGNYPVGGIPDIDENGLCDLAYMAEKGWVVQATTRQFDKNRDYLWPIPAADILVNPGLTQNPGY